MRSKRLTYSSNYISSLILIIGLLCTKQEILAQDDPFEITKYTFIDYENNKLAIHDSSNYNTLFAELTQIGLKGKGKVNIVHIGDSHIQADFLSGAFRKRIQTFFLGSISGRGFVFPYKVAKTNNPLNYKVTSTGNWESCRNVEKEFKCKLGLSGIAVITKDSLAKIKVNISDKTMPGYDFDRLILFHDMDADCFEPTILYPTPKNISKNKLLGYTLFEFAESVEYIEMGLLKTQSSQQRFALHGFNFDSNDAGITYHTIGVNGAQFESYLKCEYFVPHLKALNPNWVIVSLGTNDVYTDVFDSVKFKHNVDELIFDIKSASPKSSILLTTPGDHRIKRAYINDFTQTASSILKGKALEHKISYWDFNSIMGGKGSVDAWQDSGMAHTDFLHYTRKGYAHQGQLLFNAFLKAYDDYLEEQIRLK